MIYAAMDANRNILEDFADEGEALEWARSYKFLTGKTAFVLVRPEDEVIYDLVEVV